MAGAGLLAATTAMHLDLYQTGYRTIPTIGSLFLFQIVVGFLLAALVLLTGSRLAAAAAALFALGTLGAYLLSLQFGLFGFREVRTTAGTVAGILDTLAFGVLAVLAASRSSSLGRVVSAGFASSMRSARTGAGLLHAAMRARRAARGHGREGGLPGGLQRAARAGQGALGVGARAREAASRRADAGISPVQAGAGAAAVSLVALGLLGAALAFHGGASGSGSSGRVVPGRGQAGQAGLRTTIIGGRRVLTNASGRTLYWFAPDSPTKSVCTGTCAAYWPPVPGLAVAPPGIPGRFATITRHGGATQETYNGHPLYTYIGDSGPGEARGNGVNLNGGYWYEMVVSGR